MTCAKTQGFLAKHKVTVGEQAQEDVFGTDSRVAELTGLGNSQRDNTPGVCRVALEHVAHLMQQRVRAGAAQAATPSSYIAVLCITLRDMKGPAVHIDKDLVAASATPLVLAILAEGESYGYAVLKRVRELSGGELEWTGIGREFSSTAWDRVDRRSKMASIRDSS